MDIWQSISIIPKFPTYRSPESVRIGRRLLRLTQLPWVVGSVVEPFYTFPRALEGRRPRLARIAQLLSLDALQIN